MKINLLLLYLCIVACTNYVFSQPSDGYIKHAVPPFDNETRQLDFNKILVKPVILYYPSSQFIPQQRTGNNGTLSIADNIDVQVFPSANAQSEQHITVSKVNPNNIILNSNTPNFEGYYVSQDAGTTWFGSDNMPDNADTYGDPSTAVDANGKIFFEAINVGATGYKTYSSANQGTSWAAPVNQNFGNANFDKEMMAIDNLPGSPYLNNIYTAWTDFSGNYAVKFNHSVNGGASYSVPITLHEGWGQGTHVQTGINGEVYVCWANYGSGNYPADGIGFARSTDGGSSFTELTPAFGYTGVRVGGTDPLFNNTRVADFPSMAVDKGCIFFRGRVYIAYPAKQNGSGKSVIYVRSSDNRGSSWSDPVEISIPGGRQNWFPWIAVDDATGLVSVAYLSLDQPSGFTTNTYLAYSFDGGNAWSNIKVSDVGHTVASIPGFATGYCGDYIGNTAWANKNYVVWNDNRTGQWNNYVSRVDFSQQALFSSAADLNINGPVNHTLPTATNVFYRAAGNISSPLSSSFTAQAGTFVEMQASSHVTLNPGFNANAGCHFKAFIGNGAPCTNTIHRDNASEEWSELKKHLKPAFKGDPSIQFAFYPNPANREINIEYLLPERSDVTLTIQDLQGKQIRELLNKTSQPPGLSRFSYDVSDLVAGVYVYKLITSSYVKTGRFTKVD